MCRFDQLLGHTSNNLAIRSHNLRPCLLNGYYRCLHGPCIRHIRPQRVGDSEGEAWRRIACRTFPRASYILWTRIGLFRLLLDPLGVNHLLGTRLADPSSCAHGPHAIFGLAPPRYWIYWWSLSVLSFRSQCTPRLPTSIVGPPRDFLT